MDGKAYFEKGKCRRNQQFSNRRIHDILIRWMMNYNEKKLLFEYFIFRLDDWRNELRSHQQVVLSKLRLHKLLFFIATINASKEQHVLLSVFDNFYALPYGPVEMDIYECMNANDFTHLSFSGDICSIDCAWKSQKKLSSHVRECVDWAVQALKLMDENFIAKSVFELVDISHKWSAWQIAMEYAHLLGRKKERLTMEDILVSSKYYKL